MFGTVAHAHPVFITQKLVHRDGMVEGNPAFYRILRASGDQKGSWGHKGVEFVQVVPILQKFWVQACSGIILVRHASFSPGWGMIAEIPRLPIVDTGAGLFKHYARIR